MYKKNCKGCKKLMEYHLANKRESYYECFVGHKFLSMMSEGVAKTPKWCPVNEELVEINE